MAISIHPDQADPDDIPLDEELYWEPASRKALYPSHVGAETVHFVTVWHRDDVEDALSNDALHPITDLGTANREPVRRGAT